MTNSPGEDAAEGKPIAWVVAATMLLVAAVGWGWMAGGYAAAFDQEKVEAIRPISRKARGKRSREQLAAFARSVPKVRAVITYNVASRPWLPVSILAAEAVVAAGGLMMKRIERNLGAPPPGLR